MKKRKIHFVLTGGTIDSFYNPVTESSVPSKISVIPHYIKKVIQPHFVPGFVSVSKKDSRYMTDTTRRAIVNAIVKTKAKQVIVVHGTTTMAKTAKFLDKYKDKFADKIVLLTGAMVPLKEFAQSDGGFNLGYAIAQLEHLKPGVYVCMNARAFKAGKVTKNERTARFVSA
jgi:L-asparaginase